MKIINIAGYRFAPLSDLENLKQQMLDVCHRLAIFGSIILAEEGINLMLAGTRAAIDEFQAFLERYPEFQDMTFKESISDKQSFERIYVKIKLETIPIRVAFVDPLNHPAPYIQAKQLKEWLDEGKDIVLLDTRNEYEIEYGSFENAVSLDIDNFNELEAKLDELLQTCGEKTIVSFCTGGIRCEKAAPLMQQKGFKEVYQLEGGILRYFEECGGAHYQDDCFVFDQRVALTPDLSPVEESKYRVQKYRNADGSRSYPHRTSKCEI